MQVLHCVGALSLMARAHRAQVVARTWQEIGRLLVAIPARKRSIAKGPRSQTSAQPGRAMTT